VPRLSHPALVVAALLAVVGLAGVAAATPSSELGQARTSFRAGNFADAIPLLSGLLYPRGRLSDPGELAEAHLLLGISYFETGRKDSAERELESALFLDRNLTIEVGLFSQEAVAFFGRTKRAIERRAHEDAGKTQLAREREAVRRFMASAVVVEKRNYLLNFVPFGTGQFQNGDRKKGIAFALAQGVLAGSSIGLLSYQVTRYGLSGRVPRDEVDSVRTMQIMQVASGAAFYGLWIWGVIDALANYEPAVRRELDPATKGELEKLYRENEEHPTSSSSPRGARRRGRARITPAIGPDAAGAALSWSF
jgi:hypothetical protein